ncbi:MAG: zinc ribbon domain-containing protein [Candidatus Manganitrophaceae bacterium]
MDCKKCGFQNPAMARFCGKCGIPMGETTPTIDQARRPFSPLIRGGGIALVLLILLISFTLTRKKEPSEIIPSSMGGGAPASSLESSVSSDFVNISGLWLDLTGTVYQMTQRGNQFDFKSNNTLSGVSSWGSGTIQGGRFQSNFETNLPSKGNGTGVVSGDGKRIMGTFHDSTLGEYTLEVYR